MRVYPITIFKKERPMTSQASENLYYQGQTLALRSYPLEGYLEQLKPPMPLPFVGTHLRRSHHGDWSFEDNRLMLKKLTLYIFTHADQMRYGSPHHSVGLDYLFPNQPDGVHATWYSGVMHCVRGEYLQRVYPGPTGEYEEDLFFTLQAGVLTDVRVVRNHIAHPNDQEG
jgi:hypothetical protein